MAIVDLVGILGVSEGNESLGFLSILKKSKFKFKKCF